MHCMHVLSFNNAPVYKSLEYLINMHFLLTDINFLKPTGYVMHQQVENSVILCSTYNVFMCFMFFWEQTATCATYIVN
jgi:hypothetical protein